MLDELLNRDDVQAFIKELKTNDRYFSKELNSFTNYKMTISNELALYIFYDALYKYHLLFDDPYLFDEYMEQLDKLYKKINNYDDIIAGVNKSLCKLLTVKLGIKDVTNPESRKEIIEYVYDRYIVNGYYIHGFNTSYEKDIKENGFDPENYKNYYEKFEKLNDIFAKYNVINIIDKDFSKKEVDFTDDFLRSCYFSIYGPSFFSTFLTNEDYFGKRQKKNGYLIDDYNLAISKLKRFMSNNLFNEEDKKYVLDLVQDEWNLLHRVDKKISLLMVKRDKFNDRSIPLDDYLNSDEDVYDITDRLLSSKKGNVKCKNIITKDDLNVITLDTFYGDEAKEKYLDEYYAEVEKYRIEQENKDFMNTYGSVSVLLITGALLITLGVIITIFTIIRGI